MITLYTIPGSSATAVRLALEEAGAEYELTAVERDEAGNNTAPAGYDELNPMGKVPTLVDGELVLTEAAACCLYVAAKYPNAELMPQAGGDGWARTLRWLTLLTNTAQAAYLRWYYPEQYTSDTVGTGAVQTAAAAELGRVAQVLSDQIGDGPFLLADRFTIADGFLAMLTGWGEELEAGSRWSGSAALASHFNAVAARPAGGMVLTAEGFPNGFPS